MPDLRLAIRSLGTAPLASAVAILSLALGIGANTAVFSIAHALFFRALPVEAPDRLVTVTSDFALSHGFRNGIGWNYEMWERFRRHSGIVDGSFAWTYASFNLGQSGPIDTAHGMLATGGFFRTLGVGALLGRTFTESDDSRGGGADGPVAVITYACWQRRFGGAVEAIGSRLSINRVPFTIVGVTPPGFSGIEVGESLDVVVPLGTDPLLRGAENLLDNPGALLLTVMLRLKPAQAASAATAAMRALQPAIVNRGRTPLPAFLSDPYVLAPAANGSTDHSQLRQRYAQPMLVIAVVVALVLLVACTNIANLLLARGSARRHEWSVRLALGASPWRLARPCLVESLILSAAGATIGVFLAIGTSRWLVARLSASLSSIFLDVSLDRHVIALTTAVTVVAALLCGTMPAIRTARVSAADALRDRDRLAARSRGASSTLLAVQVAISLVLIEAAGLFLATFRHLDRVPLGFDADDLAVAAVDFREAHVPAEDRAVLAARLTGAIGATAGVRRAAASLATPGAGGDVNRMTDARGRAAGDPARVLMNAVTPGWFGTYGIPLLAGRDFEVNDAATAPAVAVVNHSLATRLFPGRTALGQTLTTNLGADETRTIVGVVADVVYGSPRDPAGAQAYVPLTQAGHLGRPGSTIVHITFRSGEQSPLPLERRLASAVTAVDPRLSFSVRNLSHAVAVLRSEDAIVARLAGFFGMVAALLAGLGLYAVASQRANHRTAELAVRLAVGGSRASLLRLLVADMMRVVLLGLAAGTVVSMWLSPLVQSLLYGVGPRDPSTFFFSWTVMLAVGTLALWRPFMRAVRTNPATLLNQP
jgi:predicted permease